MRGHFMAKWWGPSLASSIFSTQTLSPWTQLDLKPTIQRTPQVISRWGGGETRNTPNGSADYEDRRGDAAKDAPGCPSTPSTTSHLAT
jgi:hypothetical protein